MRSSSRHPFLRLGRRCHRDGHELPPTATRIDSVGARLTDKGQVTIPKHVRDGMGLRPGDEVEFVAVDGGYRLRKVLRANPFSRYRGHLAGLAGRDPDRLVRDMRGDADRG
jgi:antitoxin PrlF